MTQPSPEQQLASFIAKVAPEMAKRIRAARARMRNASRNAVGQFAEGRVWPWRHLRISLPLELASLFGGAWLYVRYIPARPRGNLVFWIFVFLLAALQLYESFGPPVADVATGVKTALVIYAVIALLAGLVDLTRKTGAHDPAWGRSSIGKATA